MVNSNSVRVGMLAETMPDSDTAIGEGGTLPATKPRIMIVDDNEDAANTLGRLLTLLGKEVRVVHSGPSAIAEFVRFQPQVILLDLGMPGMDGLETARHIRARPAGREIALVALTGWGQEQDRQRTEEAGFAAHLVKPVNLTELEAILARMIAR